MMSEEARLFLRKFMNRPKQIGSIVPSSAFLAQCMVEAVPWTSVGAVAELGSGTGAVTREIAKRVRPDAQVYLFEMDSRMRSRLADKYPRFKRAANAANLLRVMERNGTQQLDCIVSCLPFFNFPASLRDELMRQVIEALKPGGLFIAFQYSLQMKKRLSRHFKLETIKFVPWNMPPAFVYVCRKEEASRFDDLPLSTAAVPVLQ